MSAPQYIVQIALEKYEEEIDLYTTIDESGEAGHYEFDNLDQAKLLIDEIVSLANSDAFEAKVKALQ